MKEIWRPIAEWPRHEISSLGRIRRTRPTLRILQPSPNGSYLSARVQYGNDIRTRHIHYLVLEAFIGRRPKGYRARHINGDLHDNRLCNLEWGIGLGLSLCEALEISDERLSYTTKEVAHKHDISLCTVTRALRRLALCQ